MNQQEEMIVKTLIHKVKERLKMSKRYVVLKRKLKWTLKGLDLEEMKVIKL